MTPETNAPIDKQDLKRLMHAILKQAMDDYIKLQHPITRKKKYMQEAFDSAVHMFFDSEYSFMYVKDEEDNMMSLKDLVYELMGDDRVQVDKIKDHVINSARTFWENKFVNTIDIPDSLVFDGHVYSVYHTDDNDEANIDFKNKILTVNKGSSCSENQQQFIQMCMKIICYHEEYKISASVIDKLGNSVFKLMKMNSCFVGA
jgi:hypothetical protein